MSYNFLVTRPLIFLCGPYEGDIKNENNRRIPLTKYIFDKFNKYNDKFSPYPFIVDYLFNEDIIKKYDLKISLVEEIVAAIAYRTYIFLDTPSTTMELGLFSNISSNNHIKVFYPNLNNYSKGEFVDLSIRGRSDKIEIIKYEHEIYTNINMDKSITNYYYFPKDNKNERIIPESIINFLNRDISNIICESLEKKISFHKEEKNEQNEIEYFYNHENQITFKLNPKLLFYLILSLERFKSFTKINLSDIDSKDVYDEIKELVFKIFKENNDELSNNHFISKVIFKDNLIEKVVLEVNQFNNIIQTIEHMYKIMDIIVNGDNKTGNKTNSILIDRKYKPINKTSYRNKEYTLNNLLDINDEDNSVIKSYSNNYKKFINKQHMIIKGKRRLIYSYSNNKYGLKLRKLHEKIAINLKIFNVHELAFGYKEGVSILDAVKYHENNKKFIKTDISDFFGSITRGKLIKLFKVHLDVDPIDTYNNIFLSTHKNKNKKFNSKIDYDTTFEFFNIFFINNKLPLGFITSPILSNIYMYFIDESINRKKVNYSRYADDILLSGSDEIELLIEFGKLEDNLSKQNLKLNKRKTVRTNLMEKDKYLKYLGIVIIDEAGHNKIKISKSFIRKTAKLNLNSGNKNNVVIGRENFIKQISIESYKEYLNTVKIMKLVKKNKGVKL